MPRERLRAVRQNEAPPTIRAVGLVPIARRDIKPENVRVLIEGALVRLRAVLDELDALGREARHA